MNDFPHRILQMASTLLGPAARTFWRCSLLALMLAVCLLAFDSTPRGPAVGQWDKVQHLLAFVPLSFAACWALAPVVRADSACRLYTRGGLAMLAFGVFIEIVQAFIPARTASVADVMADVIGIALGLLLAWALQRSAAATRAEARR
jgi:VanZ family protein